MQTKLFFLLMIFCVSFVYGGNNPSLKQVDTVFEARPALEPCFVKCSNGDLLCSSKDRAAGLPGCHVSLIRSNDNGRTWSKIEKVIKDDDPLGGVMVGLYLLPAKDNAISPILCGIKKVKWPGGTPLSGDVAVSSYASKRFFSSEYSISYDNGFTWGEPISLDEPNLPNTVWERQMLKASNGDLLWTWATIDSEKYTAGYRRSVDGGKTWGPYTISWKDPPDGQSTKIKPSEIAAALCKNGKIIFIARSESFVPAKNFWMIESPDNGFTWSQPKKIDVSGTCPSLCTMPNGELLLLYRDGKIAPGMSLSTSNDNGKTWKYACHLEDSTGSFASLKKWSDEDRKKIWKPDELIVNSGWIEMLNENEAYVIFSAENKNVQKAWPNEWPFNKYSYCLYGNLINFNSIVRKGPNLPVPRGGHIAGIIDGKVVVAGGTNWSIDRNTKYWYSDSIIWSDGKWQIGPELPNLLAYAQFAHNENGIFVAGGTDGTKKYNTAYCLNNTDVNSQWIRLADMPESSASGSAAILNGKFYSACGYTDTGLSKKMFALNINDPNSQWYRCADLPGTERAFPTLAACGKYLYLIGGMHSKDGQTVALSDVYKYDPQNDCWQRLSDIAVNGYGWSAIAIDDKNVILAGRADGKTIHSGIWKINLDNSKTEKIADAIIQTTTAPFIRVNKNIMWLIGGEPDSLKTRTDVITVISMDAKDEQSN